jgi:SAM-dependent methyltransferase
MPQDVFLVRLRLSKKIESSWRENVHNWLAAFGLYFWDTIRALRMFRSVLSDYWNLKRQEQSQHSNLNLRFIHPCFDGKSNSESGVASGHYFHQDLLVARRIFQRNPKRHVDVGSRIDGFVAHVAVFRPIHVLDIRPQKARVQNIMFRQLDITDPSLPPEFLNCCDSLSCLHALEHFGLGRYGDTVNLNGHIDALRNLCAMLEPGGIFYLSVPIGGERIEFNAHRIFNMMTVLALTKENFWLENFHYVDDQGTLHESVSLNQTLLADNFGCLYGCGIFELRKKM